MNICVVVATGTGVGKTHASLCLLHAARGRGLTTAGLKPIESGVPTHEHARIISGAGPSAQTGPDNTDFAHLASASSCRIQPPPYALGAPVSPHLAAELAGTAISIERARTWTRTHGADLVIIETAGGLLSPLNPTETNLDFARLLDPSHLLLVSLDRLGVLHDVKACTVALNVLAPALPAPLVLLQSPPDPDASSGTNAQELQRLGTAEDPIVFPRAAPTDPASLTAATHALNRILGRST